MEKTNHQSQPSLQLTESFGFGAQRKQKTNRNGQDEIIISHDDLIFGPGAEQVKIPLDVLDIDDPENIESFSVTMKIKIDTDFKKMTSDQIFFQIGTSIVNKSIVAGLSRDGFFFVSCYTTKGKIETCFTHFKLKRQEYHFSITVEQAEGTTDVDVFVNGQNESNMNFTAHLDPLQGNFSFGSDSTIGNFQGKISEPVFFIKKMFKEEVKECFQTSQSVQGKSIVQVHNEQREFEEITNNFSKKKSVPVNLTRSFHLNELDAQRKLNQTRSNTEQGDDQMMEDPAEVNRRIQIGMIEQMKSVLFQDEILYFNSRELAVNFEWVFNLCQVISPPIEEKGMQSRITYKCLNQELPEMDLKFYPAYCITVEKFIKIIKIAEVPLSEDEVIGLAQSIDALGNHQKYGDFLFYDKLLIAVRNAALTPDELFDLDKTRREEMATMTKENTQEDAQENGDEAKDQAPKRVFEYFDSVVIEAEYPRSPDFSTFELVRESPNLIIDKLVLKYNTETGYFCGFKAHYLRSQKEDGSDPETIADGADPIDGEDSQKYQTTVIEVNGRALKSVAVQKKDEYIVGLSFGLETENGQEIEFFDTGLGGEEACITVGDKNPSSEILGFNGATEADNFIDFRVLVREEISPEEQKAREEKAKEEQEGDNTQKDGGDQAQEEEIKKEDTATEEDQEKKPEYYLDYPTLIPGWNEGRFQVVINRCCDCHVHAKTSHHYEADMAMRFNEWGSKILEYFPNVEIIGNYDKPVKLAHFEVYVRGVGPISDRDEQSRVLLYQNYTTPDMKKDMAHIIETLAMYAFEYGDTHQMAEAQGIFFEKNARFIPKKWHKSHGHPCEVPEKITPKEKKEREKLQDGTQVICRHFTCRQKYSYDSSKGDGCVYHPGRYEFGSMHALWPEGWSCCGRQWDAEGCKQGKHDPMPFSSYKKLCINHGDVNPKREAPDSACGKSYKDKDDECIYHKGLYNGTTPENGQWTCCGEYGQGAKGCVSTTHQSAEWPEEEAKLYFVARENRNPGTHRDEVDSGTLFTKRARFSGYYRKTAPYTEFVNRERQKLIERQQNEHLERYCTNWACGKRFTDYKNYKKRSCKCHPGRWDFGHSAFKIETAMTEFGNPDSDVALWTPHWTCCRQQWDAPGCSVVYHKGPLVDQYKKPKYQWPDRRAQIYFHKEISHRWKGRVEQYTSMDPETLAFRFDRIAEKIGTPILTKPGDETSKEWKVPIGELPRICDMMGLQHCVISEDVKYHLMLLEVVEGRAEKKLKDDKNYIDKQKFVEWWFSEKNDERLI